MFLFIDLYFPQTSLHSTMTSFLIGKTLEDKKVRGWKTCFVGREPLDEIYRLMVQRETRLVVVSHNIFSIRDALTRRTIRKGVANCPGRRLYFIEDVFGARWWGNMKLFHGYIGTVLYPHDAYRKSMQAYYPVRAHRPPLHFVPHGIPYPTTLDGSKPQTNKILFPSRNFGHHYPYRCSWVHFLRGDAGRISNIAFLDKGSNVTGKSFINYLGSHRAVLVVVTQSGYLIRKLYETIMAGSILLVAFPSGLPGDAARETWESLGFKNGVHYLEVTFENYDSLAARVLRGEFEGMAGAAHKEGMANHLVPEDRLERFLGACATHVKPL
jgi:hypothetical protein